MKVPKWWPLVWRSTLEEAIQWRNSYKADAYRRLETGREVSKMYGKVQADLVETVDENRRLYAEVQRLNGEIAEREVRLTNRNSQIASLTDQLVRANIAGNEYKDRLAAAEERLLAFTNPKSDSKRSKLTEAIRDQARQPDGVIDRRLLSYFRGEANRLMRDEKMSEADAIQAIGDWQTTERSDAVTADKIIQAFNDTAGL